MSSAICFNLDQSKILSCGNGLTLSQMTNFSTSKKCLKSLQTGRKNTMGKGEIALYQQFLLFPTRFILHTCKNQDLFKKGLMDQF